MLIKSSSINCLETTSLFHPFRSYRRNSPHVVLLGSDHLMVDHQLSLGLEEDRAGVDIQLGLVAGPDEVQAGPVAAGHPVHRPQARADGPEHGLPVGPCLPQQLQPSGQQQALQ